MSNTQNNVATSTTTPPPSARMDFDTDNLSPEALYIRDYQATVKICAQAMAKFDVLAADSLTAADRADARARSMQADQQLQLIQELHDAVVDGSMTIEPPTTDQVDATLALADQLAKISAQEANFGVIVNIFEEALSEFNQIHGNQQLAAVPNPATVPVT